MMWFVRPNNAEIDPKVKPVDIINVVYMPSRFSDAGKKHFPVIIRHGVWQLSTHYSLGFGYLNSKKAEAV